MTDEAVDNVVDGTVHTTETEQSEVELLEAVETENEDTDIDVDTESEDTLEIDLDAEAAAEAADEAERNGEPVDEPVEATEDTTEAPEAPKPEKTVHYKKFLNRDGTVDESRTVVLGKGRRWLDSYIDDNGDLIVPWREPKVKNERKPKEPKVTLYKKYLDKDGNIDESLTVVLGKGRYPKGYTKDDKGNVIVPWTKPKVKRTKKADKPAETEAAESAVNDTPVVDTVVAEQDAPPVVVVEDVQEPADMI